MGVAYHQTTEWYESLAIQDAKGLVSTELAPYGQDLSHQLERRTSKINAITAFSVSHKDGADFGLQFDNFAAGLLYGVDGLRALEVAPDNVITYVYPLAGNESAVGLDLLTDERDYVVEDTIDTISGKVAALYGPYDLIQGGQGLVGREPIYNSDGSLWGLSTIVMEIDPVFKDADLDEIDGELLKGVKTQDGALLYGSERAFTADSVTYKITVPKGEWMLAVTPEAGWEARVMPEMRPVRALVLILAIITLLIVVGVLFYRQTLTETVRVRTAELYRTNQLFSVLSKVNEAIVRVSSPADLYERVCQIFVDDGGFVMSWVGLVDEPSGDVKPMAVYGKSDGYIEGARISARDDSLGQGPTGRAIRENRLVVTDDIANDPKMAPWKDKALERGYKASAAAPFKMKGVTIGAVMVYAPESDYFSGEMRALLTEIVESVSYALDHFADQAATWETSQRMQAIVETIPDGITIVDKSGNLVFTNPTAKQIFGFSEEDDGNRTFNDPKWKNTALDGSPYPDEELPFSIVMRTGEPVFGKIHAIERDDGTRIALLINGAPIRDADGNLAGMVASVTDITDRLSAERELEILFDSVPAMISYQDMKGEFLRVNKAYLDAIGKKHDVVVGSTTLEVLGTEGDAAFKADLGELKQGKPVMGKIERIGGLDGEARWIQVNKVPYMTEDGSVEGVIYLAADITQQIAAENAVKKALDETEARVVERTEQLVQANTKLQELDRLKSIFIASMSHELRTPLNSIIGFSSILLNEWVGPLSEEQKKNVATVLRSGNHLLALVNDIIDISKIEAGKFDVNITPFDLKEIMEETVEAFKAESQKRGLTMDLEVDEIVVLNDRSRFVQCLNNYISNGLKFTEKGGLKISGKKSKDGKHVEIIVEDTGVGIRKKDLDRLFRPFERIEPGMEEPPPGTGLGLYLTKKITEEILGGEVAVKSKISSGSRFSLTMAIRNQ